MILPYIPILFDGRVSYFQMRQYDPNFHLKINIGQYDLHFRGLVILLNIFNIIGWMNIIVGIMDQCDTEIDFIKYIM